MKIKDDIVGFYIKRFIMSRGFIIDKPGFISFRISGKTNVFARQIVFPESFFIELEKKVVELTGEEGKKLLYSIGKKFGYSFGAIGKFENIKDHPGEKVKDWISIATKFVEGVYANEVAYEIDVKNRIVDYTLKNFAICRKLGYDFFLASGGAAGLLSWMFQDPTIEGVLYESIKTGDFYTCKVKCAPKPVLKKFAKDFYTETNLEGLDQDEQTYRTLNQESPIQYSKSFQSYINSGVFTYSKGLITYGNERFLPVEVSGLFLLERGLSVNNKLKKIIFDATFLTGESILANYNSTDVNDLLEFLSALGWGEVLLFKSQGKKYNVSVRYFPWTKWYKGVDYIIFSGLLSGFFSKIYNKRIVFKKPRISVAQGNLTLIFEGSASS